MRRREFVEAMVGAVVVPTAVLGQAPQAPNPTPPLPAPVPWTLGLSEKTPVPDTEIAEVFADPDIRFFTPTESATLEHLCDILLPALGDKPGAVAAGAPAFIDFLVGSSPDDRKTLYRTGLGWLDTEAKSRYSKPFAQLQTADADKILKPWLRTWMTDHPPTETHADFINAAHADIRKATVNSKAWSDSPESDTLESTSKELYWFPIEPDLRGRAASPVARPRPRPATARKLAK